MAIQQNNILDKIEILPEAGAIQLRFRREFEENGEVLAQSTERRQFTDDDVNNSAIPAFVRQMWNDQEFRNARAARNAREGRPV